MNAFLAQAPVAWYVARAAGLVAFGFLTLSVWLGLAMSTRLLGPRRQKPLFGWHQTLAWTGLSMLGLHAGALLFDPTLHFGFASVLVPFAAPWRPVAVAAGVITGWLMLAIASSFRLRKWIGQKGWRRLHYATLRRVLPRPRSRPHHRDGSQGDRWADPRGGRGRPRDLARARPRPDAGRAAPRAAAGRPDRRLNHRTGRLGRILPVP